MNIPAPHQMRVLNEHGELSEKYDKLCAFFGTPIFDKLDSYDQHLLIKQSTVMREYLYVLNQRIARFEA